VLRVGLNARGVAFGLVCLTCVFVTLWVAIGAGTHKNYETPTPVRDFPFILSYYFLTADTTRVSIGAGSALNTQENALLVNTYGCGSHYLPPQYSTFHYITGRRVSGRSMKSTSFVGGVRIKGLNTHRGGRRWECFCEYITSRFVNSAHGYRSSSYPLAYSLVVLPLTVARWLLFSNHHVSSAATFFAISMFYLSGAINVLLFLIIRPGLLLFPRPTQLDEREVEDIELTPQGDAGPRNFSNTPKFEQIPEPTLAAVEDEGLRDGAARSNVNSRQISIDI
jgi:hypothetical protein